MTIRAQLIFPYFTALPRDVMVNTLHFVDGGTRTLAQNADILITRLKTYVEAVYGSAGATRVNYVDWQLAEVKFFELESPPPRVPVVRSLTMSIGTLSSTVPTEVACVSTIRAAPESGIKFQSLYNRIFFGGLPTAAIEASASDQYPRLANTFVQQVRTAAINLRAANGSFLDWAIFSPSLGSTLIQQARPIVGGWVDNSPDTQRRRSVLATARNNWSVAA